MSILDKISPVEGERLEVKPGELVVARPRDVSLTPNQAREVQDYLRTFIPEIPWLVLPFAADLSVLSKAELEQLLGDAE